jgi:hypothetical protein
MALAAWHIANLQIKKPLPCAGALAFNQTQVITSKSEFRAVGLSATGIAGSDLALAFLLLVLTITLGTVAWGRLLLLLLLAGLTVLAGLALVRLLTGLSVLSRLILLLLLTRLLISVWLVLLLLLASLTLLVRLILLSMLASLTLPICAVFDFHDQSLRFGWMGPSDWLPPVGFQPDYQTRGTHSSVLFVAPQMHDPGVGWK